MYCHQLFATPPVRPVGLPLEVGQMKMRRGCFSLNKSQRVSLVYFPNSDSIFFIVAEEMSACSVFE
jgi:hypothetical protein